MDDVLGHIVLAARDEDLRAGERVGTIGIRFGLRAQDAEIGATMRFGRAHRAGPHAFHEFGQIRRFLLRRAVRAQTFIRAMRQARIHRPGLIRGVEHFVERVVHERGQALSAELGIATERGPARLDILPIRFLEARRRRHDAIARIRAAFAVTALVEREHDLGAELAGFFEHLIDGVGVEIRMLRHVLQFGFDVEQLV